MKKLVYQYITTGLQLPEYQFNQLSNNQVKSYLNIRLRNTAQLLDGYELVKLGELDKDGAKGYMSNFDSESGAELMYNSLDPEGITKIGGEEFINKISGSLLDMVSDSSIPEKIISAFGEFGKEFMLHIDIPTLEKMLNETRSPDAMLAMFVNSKDFMSNMGTKRMKVLMDFERQPEIMLEKLFDNKEIGNIITFDMLSEIIEWGRYDYPEEDEINRRIGLVFNNKDYLNTLKPEVVVKMFMIYDYDGDILDLLYTLGDGRDGFINNLPLTGVSELLKQSKKHNDVIKLLVNNKNFINKLDSVTLRDILEVYGEPEKLINFLLKKQDFINNIKSNGIGYLLENSENVEKVINILNKYGRDKGKKYISNLNSDDIDNLVLYSKDSEAIKSLLIKYGKL